ncbi:MAG: toxin-antitoxin system YwqK family antitoxin [Planctomycetota bacterium]|jgi:antitoxin component YwqK of YwqJK toxin-antitoxin module
MSKRKNTVLVIVTVVVFLGGLVWYGWQYIPGTLHLDRQGKYRGTGVAKYLYKSGQIKLKDHYVAGKLSKSFWYRPDGTVVAQTNWEDVPCFGYYLREDGSIRVKMEYVNGVAHGRAICYNKDGSIDKYVEFRNGREVKD